LERIAKRNGTGVLLMAQEFAFHNSQKVLRTETEKHIYKQVFRSYRVVMKKKKRVVSEEKMKRLGRRIILFPLVPPLCRVMDNDLSACSSLVIDGGGNMIRGVADGSPHHMWFTIMRPGPDVDVEEFGGPTGVIRRSGNAIRL